MAARKPDPLADLRKSLSSGDRFGRRRAHTPEQPQQPEDPPPRRQQNTAADHADAERHDALAPVDEILGYEPAEDTPAPAQAPARRRRARQRSGVDRDVKVELMIPYELRNMLREATTPERTGQIGPDNTVIEKTWGANHLAAAIVIAFCEIVGDPDTRGLSRDDRDGIVRRMREQLYDAVAADLQQRHTRAA
jgi:hypothetical protein